MYLSTMPMYKETTYTPRVPEPTDRQVKDIGKSEGTMNFHPNLTLLLLILII
jgi:hypothetical protein